MMEKKEHSVLGLMRQSCGGPGRGPICEGDAPDVSAPQLVVPIVQDNKNAALFRHRGRASRARGHDDTACRRAGGLEVVLPT